MPAPVLVSYTATSTFTSTTSPKTVSVAVLTGDVIVVGGLAESGASDLSTPTDTVNTYTAQETVDSGTNSQSVAMGWTAVAASSTTLTISGARTGTAKYGFGVWVWRSATVGTHASNGPTGGTSAAPSQAITTGAASSALCVAVDDWNAADGTTRTWRTVNGAAAVENTYERDSLSHTVYLGHHPDAGTAGSKTVGLSLPSAQKYSMVVIEVLGLPFPDLAVARFTP